MTQHDELVGSALERCIRELRSYGLPDAPMEARMLLEYVTGETHSWILAHPEATLDTAAAEQLAQLVDRRTDGEPIAYVLRKREFYGLTFYVDPRVLVPRPETEIVVDEALRIAAEAPSAIHILDVGTGSGAIALALAANNPSARLTASDISSDALEVAARNAHALGLAGRVELVRGDVVGWLGCRVDLVVANLPYIPADSMIKLPTEVRDYEPHVALDGGPGGIELNNRLLQALPDILRPGGHALLECEPHQIEALNIATRTLIPDATNDFLLDGFGHARVFHVTMPP